MRIFDMLFGPPNVEKLKSKSSVHGLIKASQYNKDWKIREMAVKALGDIGGPEIIDSIVFQLRHENNNVVMKTIIETLSKIGNERAVVPLIHCQAAWQGDIVQKTKSTLNRLLEQMDDMRAYEILMTELKKVQPPIPNVGYHFRNENEYEPALIEILKTILNRNDLVFKILENRKSQGKR